MHPLPSFLLFNSKKSKNKVTRTLNTQILSLLFLPLFFFGLSSSAFAGGTTTVIRGAQATPAKIFWNVVGGSQTCAGDTDFPDSADGVRNDWRNVDTGLGAGVHAASGFLSWNNIYAAPKASPGYAFTCKDGSSGKEDTAYMIVKDCLTGTSWNGTACVGVPSTPSAALDIYLNTVISGGSTGYTLSSTGAQSCQIVRNGPTGARGVASASKHPRPTSPPCPAVVHIPRCHA